MHISISKIPTIIITPPGAPLGSQKTCGHSTEYLLSGSVPGFYSDSGSSENTAGLGPQVPRSVPLSRSTFHRHSSSAKRRASSNLKSTRSRSSRDSSDQYLQVPSFLQHRPSRLRRSAQVKPLDRSVSLDLTRAGPSFEVVECGDGHSPFLMHTDERPPSVTPMFERMALDD